MLEYKKAGFNYYYQIDNIDKDLLHVEMFDDNKGCRVWHVVNTFDEETPDFVNEPDIITMSSNSCMFIGESDDGFDLYYVQGPGLIENEEMYWTAELPIEPHNIIRYDNSHVIIEGEEGKILFNMTSFCPQSDVFDNLKNENGTLIFEKSYKYLDLNKKITGVIKPTGRIGRFVYDDLDHCIKSVPLKERKQIYDYDLLDTEDILDNMEKSYGRIKQEQAETVKKLLRINQMKKNDF